jgi:TPR repeat protein
MTERNYPPALVLRGLFLRNQCKINTNSSIKAQEFATLPGINKAENVIISSRSKNIMDYWQDSTLPIIVKQLWPFSAQNDKKLVKAVQFYQKAANEGYAPGLVMLGWSYLQGEGTPENLDAAAHCFRDAATKDYPLGYVLFSLCLQNGCGVAQDIRQAINHLNIAMDQGCAMAYVVLADCLLENPNAISSKDARKLMRFGPSDVNFPDLQRGKLKQKDVEKIAAYLYSIAAAQEFATGQARLGTCFEKGTGVPQNLQKAAKYYQLAADQGVASAQVSSGILLLHNHDETANESYTDKIARETKAAAYLKSAAEQFNPGGLFNYGLCLRDGIGVPANLPAATICFACSAQLGDEHATLEYCRCLIEFGKEPQDFAIAENLLEKLAANGSPRGQDAYGTLLLKTGRVEAGVEQIRLAAANGCAQALVHLGICYMEGKGGQRNLNLAKQCFSKAVELGYEKGRLWLNSLSEQ